MRRVAPTSALVAALLPVFLLLANCSPSWALSPLSFTPCADNQGFGCTTVTVPLDYSGRLPGAVALKVERLQAGAGAGGTSQSEAVVALAGGPGQAALPLAGFLAKAFAPALEGRDLIVFDQRGTGESGPLSCPALGSPSGAAGIDSVGKLFERCALQLGPARGVYTTAESVSDIESIRQAMGYGKLVLYGVSYGTKVAEEYAARYPQNVSRLVLDSVVPTSGPDPLQLATLAAIRPVLAELCSEGACNGITATPLADIATLAARLRRHPLAGAVYDGTGARHTVSAGESDLLGILQAGDLNPALRALLPAAVRSALRGDPSPLLRLKLLTEGLIPTVPGRTPPGESSEGVDDVLNATTICEESLFPWGRSDPLSARPAEVSAALKAIPSADFYPFDAAIALEDGTIPGCEDWPDAAPAPPTVSALPNVPTLILSGEQDLRTPTAYARAVAAMIPDAQLLTVPYTGHSVLGTDFSGCAERAVKSFFAGAPVQACPTGEDPFSPTPIVPTTLDAIRPAAGVPGRAGRTLTAVLDTILDLKRQVIGATLQANQELPRGSSFGGLRGGYARLAATSLRLHRFSFVTGVQLNGVLPVKEGKLQPATVQIGGSAAAPGSVRLGGTATRVSGDLGGRRFDVSRAAVKLSRAGAPAREWESAPSAFPLPGLAGIR
jgi:pimeloyl-ACP methyl ester carboxylesterase